MKKSNSMMAMKIGCSIPHVIDIKKGKSIPTVFEIISICDSLGITPNELLDVENKNKYGDERFSTNQKLDLELMKMLLEKIDGYNVAEKKMLLNRLSEYDPKK